MGMEEEIVHLYPQEFKLSSGAIRIALRFMLMSRCRAMHPVRNTAFGEQALHGCISSFLRTAP